MTRAMRFENVDRTPWVPFVGAHGGKLIGATATEYLTSADKMTEGVRRAIELYRPDGIPVAFDLQIEAEAMGCRLAWADDNPPAVVSHPLAEGVAIEDLKIPSRTDGRVGIALEVAKRLRAEYPDIALYGLITGPFTLGLHLMGTDIFMKMFEDPDAVNQMMRLTTDVANAMAKYYIEAGCDVVAIVDPMVSQIDPSSFETFVSPYVTEVFDKIREAGALSSFFVCGNATQNIEPMCLCRPDGISIDENVSLAYLKEVSTRHRVSFGGNIQLTLSLLMGSVDDCRRDALACLDTGGKEGYIIAPGCDLPMDTPIENLVAVAELIHDEVLQGQLRASAAEVSDIEPIGLTGHWSDEAVVIDVITLDSLSCAPCQYMIQAVERASERFAGKVVWREHSIKSMDGVRMMATLGVKNLPTIVIDGNIEFISIIPPVSAIEERIEHHLKTKK